MSGKQNINKSVDAQFTYVSQIDSNFYGRACVLIDELALASAQFFNISPIRRPHMQIASPDQHPSALGTPNQQGCRLVPDRRSCLYASGSSPVWSRYANIWAPIPLALSATRTLPDRLQYQARSSGAASDATASSNVSGSHRNLFTYSKQKKALACGYIYPYLRSSAGQASSTFAS